MDTVGSDPIRTPGPMELLPAHPHVLLPASEPLFLDGGVLGRAAYAAVP